MAKIPVYERQVGTPTVNISGGMTQGLGTPYAAIQSFGDVIGKIGQMVEQSREEDAAVWASSTSAQTQVDWAQRLRDKQETAAENPQDFAPTVLREYQDYKNDLIAKAPTQRSKQRLELALNEYGVRLGVQAISFQERAQASYRANETVKEIKSRATIVGGDDAQYESQVEEFNRSVEQRGLDPVARQTLRANGQRALAFDTALGKIQRDPVSVVQLYSPSAVQKFVRPQTVQPAKQFTTDDVFPSLIMQESGGAHMKDGQLITSKAGALGITQLMPATAGKPGYGVKPLQNNSVEEYLRVGKDYFNALYNEFGGDMQKALAAYNAGPGSTQTAVWLSENTDKTFSEAGKTAGKLFERYGINESKWNQLRKQIADGNGNWLSILPKETQDYVPSILRKATAAKGGSESDFYVVASNEIDPETPMEKTANAPAWWTALSFEDQMKLGKQAIIAANQRNAGGSRELQTMRSDLHASLMATGQGKEIPVQEYMRYFPPAVAERYYQEDKSVRELGNFGMTVRGMTPQQQESALGLPPGPGQSSFVYDMYSKKQKMISDARAARDKDPPAYTATVSPLVQKSLANLNAAQKAAADNPSQENQDAVGSATRLYVVNSLAEQERLGVRVPQILTDVQAEELSRALNSPQQGENAALTMQRLAQQYGKYWMPVVGELSKKNKLGDQALVMSAGISSAATAASLAEGNQVGRKELEKVIGEGKVKGMDDSITRAMKNFSATVVPLSGGGTKTELAYREQIAIAALMKMRAGDTMKDAVEKSYTELVSHRYSFNGTYRVPMSYKNDLVSRGANQYRNAISPETLADVAGVSDQAFRKSQQVASIKSNGYWVTTADPDNTQAEAGLTLYVGGSSVLNSSGKPIFVSFDELQAIGQRTAAAATPEQFTQEWNQAVKAGDTRKLDQLRQTQQTYQRGPTLSQQVRQ
jgi:soluble lytic murein transglycosylase-like protein